MGRVFSGLRPRLLLLVLLAIVSAFRLVFYSAAAQRRMAVLNTRQEALKLARAAAREHKEAITRARQLPQGVASLNFGYPLHAPGQGPEDYQLHVSYALYVNQCPGCNIFPLGSLEGAWLAS